jgi:hypothetical protein
MTKVRVRVTFAKNIYNETRCCRKMMKAMTSFVLNLDFDKKKKRIILMVAISLQDQHVHTIVLVDGNMDVSDHQCIPIT